MTIAFTIDGGRYRSRSTGNIVADLGKATPDGAIEFLRWKEQELVESLRTMEKHFPDDRHTKAQYAVEFMVIHWVIEQLDIRAEV